MTIEELQNEVIRFRDARDWKQFHNPKDLAISLTLEATEVLEHFQWKTVDEMKKHVEEHKSDVSEELADVLYWVLLLSKDLDVDLVDAFKKKMQKNETKYPIHKAKGSHKKYTEL